uniref:SHSP domain-containing protein n=1 Tax=Brassica campestris TaxID=3711 RepID=M4DZY2_BRACM
MEIKILQNDNLYIRVDLPGVPDDGVRHRVDSVRQKVVFFSGEETLSDGDDKKNAREYAGTAGLGCDCCEITGVDAKMKDGVLRMIVSRVKVKDHDNKCTLFLPPNTGKSGRYNMDEPALNMAKVVEDHPFVVKGPKRSENSVQRRGDGSVWVSFDLPGVCGDDILVLPNENEVKFYGENKEVYEHDESCRIFMGAVMEFPF